MILYKGGRRPSGTELCVTLDRGTSARNRLAQPVDMTDVIAGK
jgi:hypothetical protein